MQPEWRRQMLISLSKVLGIAVCVGLVVGGLALAGADALGLTDDDGSAPAPAHAATKASGTPSATPSSASPGPGAGEQQSRTATPTPTPTQTQEPKRAQKPDHEKKPRSRRHHERRRHAGGVLTLSASPRNVHKYGRVSLSGRYPGHNGTTLRVQRAEPDWHDFPVTVTVRGGRFHTWVESGYPGVNRFRVVDTRTGKTSAPVTVRVH